MENPISVSNQCLSDQVYIVDGGAVKSLKSGNNAPPNIIGSKSLKHFNYVPKHRDEARHLFLTYVRTRMFYQMRMREEDGKQPVHIPMPEIEERFFRRPRFNRRYELQWLIDAGELEVTTKASAKGFTMFYYKALNEGMLDLAMLRPNSAELDDLTSKMRDHLLDVDLIENAPSTPYFDTFLKLKHQYLDLFFIVDRFSGRIHTPISNFHRTHRPNILIQGSPTESFDVTTMQPLLLGKILKDQIGSNEFSDWIDSGKDIYLMLQRKANLKTRDEGKKRFFEILFSRPNNSLEMLFGASEWIKWVNQYKGQPEKDNPHTIEKEHSNLAWLLQTTEVNLMRKVWSGLVEAQIPFLSVHDEIIVKNKDLYQSENIFDSILGTHLKYYKLNSKS